MKDDDNFRRFFALVYGFIVLFTVLAVCGLAVLVGLGINEIIKLL